MGRKSEKTKEKKMKRKEENAKLAVVMASVNAADALDDPMANLAPFKKFERNGLSLAIDCHRVADMDEETVKWAYEITKENMQTLYETSDWGWSDQQKREEMSEEKARYLIARNQDGRPVACVHFRFDMDCDDEVLYCYEIQLMKEVRRKGLGKFLMQILELMAFKTGMKKVMLTVFKHNEAAGEFFVNKLKYEVDETSPEESMAEALYEEEGYSYQIISKQIGVRKPAQTNSTPHGATAQQHNGHSLDQNGHSDILAAS